MVSTASARPRSRFNNTMGWLCVVAAGWYAPGVAAETPAPKLPPVKWVPYPSLPYRHVGEYKRETYRMLSAGDTDGLEKQAAQLRKSRESIASGRWLLSDFYSNAVSVDTDQRTAQSNVDWYKRWATEHPKSITAQICLARALIANAWNARGGPDGKPDKEGWRLYYTRLAEAWNVLQRASKLEEKCPDWYATTQRLAFSQGWSRNGYLWLTEQGLQSEPTYTTYYSNAVRWFRPKWHGRPGDLEKWIGQEADHASIKERDRLYARLVWLADAERYADAPIIFRPGRFDWERTRNGFDDWLKEAPDNLPILSEYARLAIFAGDRDTARAALERLGGNFVPGFWDDNVSNFERSRKFAFLGGDSPLPFRVEREREPRFSPTVLANVAFGVRLFCGFVGGVLAGALLLILAIQRKKPWGGALAFTACLMVSTPFGTLATLLPAAGLWIYLRKEFPVAFPDLKPSRWWVVLLWVLGIECLNLALQLGATIFAIVPRILEGGGSFAKSATNEIFRDGTAFLICLNAMWIALLALLAVCRPQSRDGWKNRLGLHHYAFLPSLLWVVLTVVLMAGVGYALEPFVDARTRSALALFAQAAHSPVTFFLTLSLAGPVLEELTFRGYAYSGWVDKFGALGTCLATTVLFTCSHVQYGWSGLLGVFLLGLALSGLRWKTGSIYPGMAIHMLNNLIAALGFYFARGGG